MRSRFMARPFQPMLHHAAPHRYMRTFRCFGFMARGTFCFEFIHSLVTFVASRICLQACLARRIDAFSTCANVLRNALKKDFSISKSIGFCKLVVRNARHCAQTQNSSKQTFALVARNVACVLRPRACLWPESGDRGRTAIPSRNTIRRNCYRFPDISNGGGCAKIVFLQYTNKDPKSGVFLQSH